MQYTQIENDFAVAPQITPGDVAAIKQAGFKSIVCNRPDSEMGASPHEGIAKAAEAAGIAFRYLPVAGPLSSEDVGGMAEALRAMPRPLLAYCRSGARSTNLYMAAKQLV